MVRRTGLFLRVFIDGLGTHEGKLVLQQHVLSMLPTYPHAGGCASGFEEMMLASECGQLFKLVGEEVKGPMCSVTAIARSISGGEETSLIEDTIRMWQHRC